MYWGALPTCGAKKTPAQSLQTAEAQHFIPYRTGGLRATAELRWHRHHSPLVTLCLSHVRVSLYRHSSDYGNVFELTTGDVSMSNTQKSLFFTGELGFHRVLCSPATCLLSFLALLFGGARPGKAPQLQAGGGVVADVVGVEHGSWAEDIHVLHRLLPFLFGAFAFGTLGLTTFTRLQRENDHKNTQLALHLDRLDSG